MSHWTFFMGVMNLAMTAFICGYAPEAMWLYTTVKISILVPKVLIHKYPRKTHWYMVDMCWAILYFSWGMGVSMFMLNFFAPHLFMEYPDLFIQSSYAYFGFACGPIGLYIIMN